jgi:hypothetical protein
MLIRRSSKKFQGRMDTIAKATAVGVICVAARANAPFISYICQKPSSSDTPPS